MLNLIKCHLHFGGHYHICTVFICYGFGFLSGYVNIFNVCIECVFFLEYKNCIVVKEDITTLIITLRKRLHKLILGMDFMKASSASTDENTSDMEQCFIFSHMTVIIIAAFV